MEEDQERPQCGVSPTTSPLDCFLAPLTPFGGVHTSTGALPTARFPGQWFQSESGLHQNWMRDYDPTTGRYLEPGPLELVDGASDLGDARQKRWLLLSLRRARR